MNEGHMILIEVIFVFVGYLWVALYRREEEK